MLSLYTHLSARLRQNEKGATAVEYGIMVALIAVVIIVAVTTLGGNLNDAFQDIADRVAPKTTTPPADTTE